MKRESDGGENNSAGQSRAAKRRRKQKEKQQQHNVIQEDKPEETVESDEETNLVDEEKSHLQNILISEETYDSNEGISELPLQITGVHLCDVPDSTIRARNLFEWILCPLEVETKFYEDYYENMSFALKRPNGKKYYSQWIQKSIIQNWIQSKKALKNEDYFLSKCGKQSEDSTEDNWRLFEKQGWSLRFNCPQKFDEKIRDLLSCLEEEFSASIGCNAYLTPKGEQGLAPHYEDVDSFVLQVEGSQIWKVYTPLSESEVLPRFTSQDLPSDSLDDPVFEVRLDAGDLLYLPRGFVHEARTPKDTEYSLHLSIVTNRRNSVADLLELVVQEALEEVIQNSREARQSLPRNYLDFLGVVNVDNIETEDRLGFENLWSNLLDKIKTTAEDFLDAGADQIAKKYIAQRLPFKRNQVNKKKIKVSPDSKVHLIRKDIARLVLEQDKARLYHCLSNEIPSTDSEYQFGENSGGHFLEFEVSEAALIEQILRLYPQDEAICVSDLEYPEDDEAPPLNAEQKLSKKLELVRQLANCGIVQLSK